MHLEGSIKVLGRTRGLCSQLRLKPAEALVQLPGQAVLSTGTAATTCSGWARTHISLLLWPHLRIGNRKAGRGRYTHAAKHSMTS